MSLASFASFIINVFGLCVVVGLIIMALDSPYIRLDAWIKKFAKFAVGGAACLAFIIYCFGFFGGVGGGAALMRATPESILEFAIGMILLIAGLYVIEFVIAWLMGAAVSGQPTTAPPAGLAGIVIFVLNIAAIAVILYLAEKALFGGGLGLIPNFTGLGAHPQPTGR
jgi:hypothetical protein